MKIRSISAILLAAAAFPAVAATIGTSHISESGNTFFVDQEFEASFPPDRDFTGTVFTATGSFSYEYGGSFLDEGASVFLVEANDTFSEAGILAGDFVELTLGTVYTFQPIFFLAIRTPALGVDFGAYEPAYGWIEVQNFGTGDLVLIGHAIAYDTQGIVVDTLTAVPEPLPAESIKITSYSGGPGLFSITWATTPPGAAVDVYRSTDLASWGSPIATCLLEGSHSDSEAPSSRVFYIVVPAGSPPSSLP
jgi:hypothetical protein